MTHRTIISLLLIASPVILMTSCNLPTGVIEPIDTMGIIANSNSLDVRVQPMLEGVYRIADGYEDFGEYAAVKLTRNHLSIFCGKNASYFVFSSGEKDSSFSFEGFWRYSQTSSTGIASLGIGKTDGGAALLSAHAGPLPIVMKGYFIREAGGSHVPLRLEYVRPLPSDSSFSVIAHRGGGRNSDRLQASENSVELLQLAEYFGANSVEIDVQLTKDTIPILFHDEDFSSRLVNGNYLIGSVSSFSFKQVRTFGKLINGETIPSLDEALEAIVTKTSLKLVWLDVKSPAAIAVVAPLQKKYADLARSMNRDVTVLIGLPDADVFNAYIDLPGKEEHASLCELDIVSVRKADARVWAPRWTDGIQKQQIAGIQAEGRKVFVWTLDDPGVIADFLGTKYYNGILTNYPSVVAYQFYLRTN